LEHQGLIRRRLDARDRRRSLLGLTNKGRRFDVGAEGTIEAAIQHALEQTKPRKIEAARELLATIAGTLGSPRSTAAEQSVQARRESRPPSRRR
jgi:DNA-binding MarR family transcriptional regulator